LQEQGSEIDLKEMSLFDLSPGSFLAKPVTGKSGITMLESGTRLTEHYIERLKKLGITSVFVQDSEDMQDKREVATTAAASNRWELIKRKDREALKNDEQSRLQACNKLVELAQSDHQLEIMAVPFQDSKYRKIVRDILQEIAGQRPLTEELCVLYQTDHFLFQHSLRVGMLSSVLGMAKQYDSARLYELMVGGLLFDIGMTLIPQELLRKKEPLRTDERALIRRHTTEGYRILTAIREVPAASAKCALMHHERYRGEGYPHRLTADKIPEIAQIVGLSDLYNALMSPRHHRDAFPPSDAIEYLFAAGNYDFDISLIWLFLRNIFVFPVSSVIQLSNGQIGIVSAADIKLNHRPVVRIIREADGTTVKQPYELDLMHHSNITITGALPDLPEG